MPRALGESLACLSIICYYEWTSIDHTDYTYLTFTQQESFKSYSVSLAKSFSATDLAKTEVLGLSSVWIMVSLWAIPQFPFAPSKPWQGKPFSKPNWRRRASQNWNRMGSLQGCFGVNCRGLGTTYLSIASKWIICPGAPIVPMINAGGLVTLRIFGDATWELFVCFLSRATFLSKPLIRNIVKAPFLAQRARDGMTLERHLVIRCRF